MTSRLWRRCDELESARVVFINHLDRDRADFGAALAVGAGAAVAALRRDRDPDRQREGLPRRHRRAAHGRLRGRGRRLARGRARARSRRTWPTRPAIWRERLVEAVVEVSDDLTAKYLDGEEITADELREALHAEVLRGELFPVACGSATKNEGTHALLDLIVEGVPAPSENFIAARAGDEDVVLSSSESLDGRVRLQDGRRRARRPHQLRARVLGHAARRRPARQRAHRHEGAHRPGARGAGQGAPSGAPSSARATSAPCPSSRTWSPATCWPSAR